MTEKNVRKVDVLMIEDDNLDAYLTLETLSESDRAVYETVVVPDALLALSYLKKRNGYENSSRPEIILLDLNLPMMHGFDFLKIIKEDADLQAIPVCILSTSKSKEDIAKAKELGAECYLEKPLDLEEYEKELSRITGNLL